MAVTQGGDPQRMREVSEQLADSAEHLQGITHRGTGLLATLLANWSGLDAQGFAHAWPDARSALVRAEATCRAMATGLQQQADEQERASAGRTGAIAGVSAGRALGTGSPDALAGLRAPIVTGLTDLPLTNELTAPAAPPPPADDPLEGQLGEISPEVAAQWETYTDDERRAILEQMVLEQAEEYGIEPPPIVTFKNTKDLAGEYYDPNLWNGGRGRVVIDDTNLADPDVLNTASHETRHAMQQQAVEDGTTSWWEDWRGVEPTYDNGVTPEEVEAWHENQGDYTEWDEDPQGYVDQPLEADAFEEERRRAEELTPEELDRLLEASESG